MILSNKIIIFFIILISGCQSAHIVKKEAFKKEIDPKLSFFNTEQQSMAFHTLASNKKGSVLIFWQNSCPCVKRYQNRVSDLFNTFGDRLAFYYISSNTNERFKEVKEECERRKISLPILRDEGGEFAKTLNIKGTPSAVLLDSRGEILFMGWIDNERDKHERGRKSYLEDAIVNYLSDEPINISSSPMFGCAIR